METNIYEWIEFIQQNFEDSTRRGIYSTFGGLFQSCWFATTTRYQVGTNIFEYDWDILIVLDGCRVDALQEVSEEYDLIEDVESIWSVGSASHEWICKTFTENYIEEIQKTAIIMCNDFAYPTFEEQVTPPRDYVVPFETNSWKTVSNCDFLYTDWVQQREDPYTKQIGYPELSSAEFTTERAIVANKKDDFERLVVQYYQPHRPFIFDAMNGEDLTEKMYYPFKNYSRGDLQLDELWNSYLDNLRYGLDSVMEFLNEVDDKKVIITSDHGELIGELGLFGHKEGVPHPNLKKVPWVELTL